MKLRLGHVLIAAAFACVLQSAPGRAQSTEKVYRVGIMVNGASRPFLDRFRQDFEKLGYVGDRKVVVEGKFAEGQIDRHPMLARELVAERVDIILSLGGPASKAAKDATSEIPVVFAIVTDPVALGLVASMDKPGGNVTGVTSLDPQQAGKQLQLLRQAFPDVTRIAILSDVTIPGADERGLAPIDRANDKAARDAGLEPYLVKLKGGAAADLEGAFAEMRKAQVGAVLVLDTPISYDQRKRIGELAITNRLPAMFSGGLVDGGGLITYGTNVADTWFPMVVLADKILKGANPGGIPVESVKRSELVINMVAARKLGVTLPPDFIKRADRVIE